ncbi:uncharacterized protein EI90DRAFT_3034489 [Cantharellus anzutake]|uniref:uncharacterized protein n=1 Tax=Cantharellus anzutake TaxID=1750568 RepID=UPI001907988E|nr:uncharacterized protein EI90DRAFT_3034489 [Cantharellus anzutake]KAF8341572.1 hypothetical protein EI90DRAFT_3034489 [Cantharellus anzutake]
MNIPTPFARRFPFDVLCGIISQLESGDRLAFSLVNHSCNREASKYIWRTVNIGTKLKNHSIRGLAAAADVILSDRPRAHFVRELNIHHLENLISLSNGPNDRTASIEKFIRALHFTPNLTRLSFTGWSFGRQFACSLALALSAEIFPFQLEHFSTNISVCDGLEGFLVKQWSIRSFHQIYDPQTNARPPCIPGGILPNLESVCDSRVSAIIDVVKGRQVQSISTSTRREEDVDSLLRGLTSSTSRSSLKTLRLSADEIDVITDLLFRIPSDLPNLECIGFDFQNASISSTDWDPFMFDSIFEFERLREFRWSGDSIPEALWNPVNCSNAALRRVELVLMGSGGESVVHVLTRSDENSRWRLRESKATGVQGSPRNHSCALLWSCATKRLTNTSTPSL